MLQTPEEKEDHIKRKLRSIDGQEKRIAALLSKGQVSEKIWQQLWEDWLEQRRILNKQLALLHNHEQHLIENLDDASSVLSQLPAVYDKLRSDEQREVLRAVIAKIVVDKEGKILQVALQPPFALLYTQYEQAKKGMLTLNENSTTKIHGATSKQIPIMLCLSFVSLGAPGETQLELLSPLSEQDISQLTFPNKKKLSRYFDL